jgi:hypothetical protein
MPHSNCSSCCPADTTACLPKRLYLQCLLTHPEKRHTSSVSGAVDGGGGGAATRYEAAGLAGAQARIAPSLPAARRLPAPVANSARTLQQI